MKCQLCGFEFSDNEAIESCISCPIKKCGMKKCPNCGYEILPEPGLIKFLKRRFKHENK